MHNVEAAERSEVAIASERLLTTLAILQVNWDESHKSHLDNFVPFLLEAMRRQGLSNVTEGEVAIAVRDDFGIALPTSVARAVLRRAEKQGSCTSTGGRYSLAGSKAKGGLSAAIEQEFLRKQRNLAESLAEYMAAHSEEAWTASSAEAALLDYVESNAPDLLAHALRGEEPKQSPSGDKFDRVLVAGWIEGISRNDPPRFDYLVTIVKGSMLAAVIGLPDHGELNRPFRGTTLVLDTPLLLQRLGYAGSEAQQAMTETISLASRQHAKIACLQKSVAEARNILHSAAQNIGREIPGPPRPLDSYFAEQGFSRSQALMRAEQLEDDLKAAGIAIHVAPSATDFFTIDELALEAELTHHVHPDPTRRDALLHDLDALTAIHRIRAGQGGDRLETCRAVFVTRNVGLVKVARTFPDFATHKWPLAMTNDHLSTMVWVKRPMAAPDLPRHQLLAKCYSLLAPSEEVWARYLDQIERLRRGNELTERDVLLLKYTQEAQHALAQATSGHRTPVARDTVFEIRRALVEELAGQFRGEAELARSAAARAQDDAETARREQRDATALAAQAADRESSALAALEAERRALQSMTDREASTRKRIGTRAHRLGTALVGVLGIFIVLVTVAALQQTAPPWPLVGNSIVTVLTLLGGFAGPGRALRRWAATHIEARDLRRLGLPPVADEPRAAIGVEGPVERD